MVTRVADVVTDEGLALQTLHAGDVRREVRWVHVSELADPSPYLAGGELLLTAGVWRGRDVSATDFVRALSVRDVVAVGWGLLEGDTAVPRDVLMACRASDITLFAVPVATPFIAISQWFVERITAEREAGLHRALEFSRALLEVADDATPDVGPVAGSLGALERVCDLLAAELDLPVAVVDGGGQLLAEAVDRADKVPPESWASYDIGQDGRPAQLLVARTDQPGDARQGRIEAALPVVGLVLARRRAWLESERRLAGEALAMVRSEQDEAARVRLAGYGVDPVATLVAVALVSTDPSAGLRGLENWLAREQRQGVAAQRGAELNLVVVVEGPQSDEQLTSLGGAVSLAAEGRATGVGEPGMGLAGLRRSLHQAEHSCRLAGHGQAGSVVVHGSSGDHRTLLSLHDASVVGSFRDAVLGPVEEYDRVHGSSLVETLRAFLQHDGGWKRCAEALGMHVNTLRQRISRVETLTGRSLERTADRVDFWLALVA